VCAILRGKEKKAKRGALDVRVLGSNSAFRESLMTTHNKNCDKGGEAKKAVRMFGSSFVSGAPIKIVNVLMILLFFLRLHLKHQQHPSCGMG
jgi:hypothetical protein